MRDITTDFGHNAGIIWDILNKKGVLKKDILLNETTIGESNFHAAIGWLARENKISCNDNYFRLEQTNLESEISNYAGLVWNILDTWGNIDFESIKKLSHLDDNQVYSALGWLAREGKIKANDINDLALMD